MNQPHVASVITNYDLARRLFVDILFQHGVNRCTVSAWEAGRHRPSRTHREQISALVTSAAGEDDPSQSSGRGRPG